VPGIGRVEPSRGAGGGQRNIDHLQAACGRSWGAGFIGFERGLLAEQARALGEQRAAADDDDLRGKFCLGQCQAQIGPDSGGFACGNRDLQSLYST
jgi:hypothetical protein